ncbi:MAG TPA: GPP34 family phosphoprotein [Bacteroidales bacterium]|nr:GPP34 family phosphoprotein [Bacteroidales bacterium]
MNTSEKFLLLIQHPVKSRFLVSEPERRAGLIGSVLLDLVYAHNLETDNKKLIVRTNKTEVSEAHRLILQKIDESKQIRKTRSWIEKLFRQSGNYQKRLLNDLENKKIIKIIPRQFLFIKYYRSRLVNTAVRDNLIEEIRDIIFKNKKADNENALILGLIEACNMYKIICRDRFEKKICKKELKELRQTILFPPNLDLVIKGIQTAIREAIMAYGAAV